MKCDCGCGLEKPEISGFVGGKKIQRVYVEYREAGDQYQLRCIVCANMFSAKDGKTVDVLTPCWIKNPETRYVEVISPCHGARCEMDGG